MKAIFERKPSDFNPQDFEVSKTLRLPAEVFEAVLENPQREYDFIQENIEQMHCDSSGVYHCLLLTGEGRNDGLLVESEGYGYCRYASYVPNISGLITPGSSLKDLLHVRWEDIHLLHKDVEVQPATIVELDEHTLTNAGKEAWTDILDAEVVKIYNGYYGLQMELDKVKPSRLEEFSSMLAGYCPVSDYEKWVTQEGDAPSQSPEMK
ncbi:DUF6329 domain-containing protein [Lacrimispora saccharolytica]|uniref:DUF6329 domain-containing protein n=1 Tax=Lacrimispora saccharolytica (strain ATCC 35040 / DSM 2544 / NRCC 2533 / WM1) TaxID=610130 RepID=D9R809_LACSW|nr:DUF6329 domain-containing protein [Lacrimispora saccharolytica]ADL05663.1 conserved hypothetical protein [[Clostridium] saccharolyticum WM1]QRV20192.1 hypothetical protein I6K70_01115 [Lacrimispora saccharolytica]